MAGASSDSGSHLLAITCGEPSGIGPDVILKTYARRDQGGAGTWFVLGDRDQLAARAERLGLSIAIEHATPQTAAAIFPEALPVVATGHPMTEAPGRPDPANAAGVIAAIEQAVALCFSGNAAGMVTAPIAKKPLYDAGFAHPGHTEFLAALASAQTGEPVRPVMMIAGPKLRTIPVTIHIPLAAVPSALTTADIIETVRIAADDLKSRFGIERPRIAVSGLNPHAGEDGALGHEDREIILPAIERLLREGIAVTGPLPADTMFHEAARAAYDVAVCMYHDQALVPAKALGFDDAVNVTLGLPFIRTSPDHGTAFAIAGTGAAREDSFVAALMMARAMASRHIRDQKAA